MGDDRGSQVLPRDGELLTVEHGMVDAECGHEHSWLSGLQAS